jgi:hypothetical protein
MTFEERAERVLAFAFAGIHHVLGWRRRKQPHPDVIEVIHHGELASFDGDCLTMLVLAAHAYHVRVSIDGRAPNYLRITMHNRRREGILYDRHPTIDHAIERARRSGLLEIEEEGAEGKEGEMNLEDLGITKDELVAKVVERLCERYEGDDEDGWESRVTTGIEATIKSKIDDAVAALAEKHVIPGLIERVEGICFAETNRWGESSGKTLTFREYLIERTNAWITEKVAHDGSKPDPPYKPGTQTRLTHIIHEHLHYQISNAVKAALQAFNSQLATSLRDTIALKLQEFQTDLKVTLAVKGR